MRFDCPWFNTPSGNVVYVATTGTNVASGGGTTGAPYQTIAYAVAQVNAGVHGTTATILLRSSDLGTDEAVFRESFPQIAGTSKVLGIQAEKGAQESTMWAVERADGGRGFGRLRTIGPYLLHA